MCKNTQGSLTFLRKWCNRTRAVVQQVKQWADLGWRRRCRCPGPPWSPGRCSRQSQAGRPSAAGTHSDRRNSSLHQTQPFLHKKPMTQWLLIPSAAGTHSDHRNSSLHQTQPVLHIEQGLNDSLFLLQQELTRTEETRLCTKPNRSCTKIYESMTP